MNDLYIVIFSSIAILSASAYVYAIIDPKCHWWAVSFKLRNASGSDTVSQFVCSDKKRLNRGAIRKAIKTAGYDEIEVSLSDVSYLGRMSVIEWNGEQNGL